MHLRAAAYSYVVRHETDVPRQLPLRNLALSAARNRSRQMGCKCRLPS